MRPWIRSGPGFSRRSGLWARRHTGLVSHTILAKAARLKLFGKSPAGFYLRLNRRIWEIIPVGLRNFYPIRAYGAWLHSLVRLQAAGTDEAGHAFQLEAGRVFQSEAGHPWRQSHGSI